MKFILMYTIEDDAHREAFFDAIREYYGAEYISEEKSLDQSSYGLPGRSLLDVYTLLLRTCAKISKELGGFNRDDKVDLYYAENPKNNEIEFCDISRIDVLENFRKVSL